jgi:hypothetical protein
MIRLLLLLAFCVAALVVQAMERIVLAPDGKSFVTADSKKPFVPWGVNYGNAGRLMEDFWDKEWATIEGDFAEIRQLGGNVVRVHLQYGKFMEAPNRPNRATFLQWKRMLDLAEKSGLYLDVTGLACYRTSNVPKWYDEMDDATRWNAQASFWQEIAKASAHSPAIFCYDLMNEPVSPGDKSDKWYSGHLLGGYDFIQRICRDPKGRPRNQLATDWIDRMSAPIKKEDPGRLITVGMLPWVTGWNHLSGFLPAEVAQHVDFLSVHIYPKTKQSEEAERALKECAVGKAVVIEETFPLECSPDELKAFLLESRKIACGWVFHYDGTPPADYDALEKTGPLPPDKAIWRAGIRLFETLRAEISSRQPEPVSPNNPRN